MQSRGDCRSMHGKLREQLAGATLLNLRKRSAMCRSRMTRRFCETSYPIWSVRACSGRGSCWTDAINDDSDHAPGSRWAPATPINDATAFLRRLIPFQDQRSCPLSLLSLPAPAGRNTFNPLANALQGKIVGGQAT